MPALTVEQPQEGMTVLKRVAEEKKVGSALRSHSNFHLTLRKASSLSVVEKIPETDTIKLGKGSSLQLLWLDCTDPDLQDSPDPTNTKTPH